MIQKLLEVRKQLKERNPEFIRQDTHKRKKLEIKWKKPQGVHSKIRHRFKGRGKMPSPGYKSPIKVKGLHASGLRIVNIYSPTDLESIKKESEGIIISKSVGMRKRLDILKEAKDHKINVLNINLDEHMKKIQDFIDSKKKETPKEKKHDTKEPKEAKDKKEQDSKDVNDEQKKETEKKEKDKVLTKRL